MLWLLLAAIEHDVASVSLDSLQRRSHVSVVLGALQDGLALAVGELLAFASASVRLITAVLLAVAPCWGYSLTVRRSRVPDDHLATASRQRQSRR